MAPAKQPSSSISVLLAQPGPAYAVPRASRAMRPETEIFARAAGRAPSERWAAALRRLEQRMPGHHIDKKLLKLPRDDEAWKPIWTMYRVLAIVLYDEECAGTICATRDGRGDMYMLQPSLPFRLRPRPQDLKLILEYILCADYAIERPSLAAVAPGILRGFAALAIQLFTVANLISSSPFSSSSFSSSSSSSSSSFSSSPSPSSSTSTQIDITAVQKLTSAIYANAWSVGLDATDVALIYYHFARQLLSPSPSSETQDAATPATPSAANNWGFDTYTGARPWTASAAAEQQQRQQRQEAGTEARVLRKLSVDTNDVVPTVVFNGRRKELLLREAGLIAADHGWSLARMDLAIAVAYPPPRPYAPASAAGAAGGVAGLADLALGWTDGLVGLALSWVGGGGGRGAEENAEVSNEEWLVVDVSDDEVWFVVEGYAS